VHVQVPRKDIYDSSFLVGAVTLQLCALAMGMHSERIIHSLLTWTGLRKGVEWQLIPGTTPGY